MTSDEVKIPVKVMGSFPDAELTMRKSQADYLREYVIGRGKVNGVVLGGAFHSEGISYLTIEPQPVSPVAETDHIPPIIEVSMRMLEVLAKLADAEQRSQTTAAAMIFDKPSPERQRRQDTRVQSYDLAMSHVNEYLKVRRPMDCPAVNKMLAEVRQRCDAIEAELKGAEAV